MEEVIRKKLNLLVHLATIDGKFDETEKDVLKSLLAEAGLNNHAIQEAAHPVNLNDFKDAPTRADILYWALRIIKADGQIHADEAAYCKALAVKLNYKADIVDHFTKHELGDQADFKKAARPFAASSI